MKFFIAGSTGATGRHVTRLLLDQGHQVVALARNPAVLENEMELYPDLTVIAGSLLDLQDNELDGLITGCDGVISCLGHNLTLQGIFGAPRLLCRDAIEKMALSIIRTRHHQSPKQPPVKMILMNTNGNRNRDLDEKLSMGDRVVIGLVRYLLPPHRDNELAADFLRVVIGQKHPDISWSAVRPDGLVDSDQVSGYQCYQSPVRGVVFNSGQVSRINVAHFMTRLVNEANEWQQWQGRMPVIYNIE